MDTHKQQVIDRLTKANNVLVTVSTNPTVDQLAAAIGFSLVLNKLGKHASAVYSGETPSVIEFLQPDTTLEKTTDSLRDFIISLDKEKADKLRYKVEDTVVRIFITPYRTSISDKDLEFSQGDFNVDVVVALGVHEQLEIDQAITAHGRILHDATVLTITNDRASDLGAINLFDEAASSLSEVVASLATLLGNDALDGQISTALLTGIVAETGRFGNDRTTADTLRLSSTLLAAGADQQLVATKLEPVPEPTPVTTPQPAPILAAPPTLAEEQPAPESDKPKESVWLPVEDKAPVEPEAPPEIHIDANGTLQITHDAPGSKSALEQNKPHESVPTPEPSSQPEAVSETPVAVEPVSASVALPPSTQPYARESFAPPLVPTIEELGLPVLPKPQPDHPSITHSFSGNKPLEDRGDELDDLDSTPVDARNPQPGSEVPILSHGGTAAAVESTSTPNEQATVDAARDAVLSAMGSNQPLPPVTALNAQPLGEPIQQNPDQPEQTMTLPVPNGIPQFVPGEQPPAGPAINNTLPSSAPPVPPPVFPLPPQQ